MTASQLPTKCVLVVDDDKDTAESAAKLLTGLGFEALTAFDAESALQVVESKAAQVVLLDLAMPKIDGYQLARALRAVPDMEQALLICISGYGTDEDRKKCYEAGFDYHFLKPVNWQEVVRTIRRHVD